MTDNERRAQRVADLTLVYRQWVGEEGEDDETVLTDLLADLMHWADTYGVDWTTVSDRAALHFSEEREETAADETDETDETDAPLVSLDRIAELIIAEGIPAIVEMTGGGVQTIMVGTQSPDAYGDDRYQCLVGPGWWGSEGPTAYLGELCYGKDDQGETKAIYVTEQDTAETIATQVVNFVRNVA